jgi:hypothetical protein
MFLPTPIVVLVYISISRVRGDIYARTPKSLKYLQFVTKRVLNYCRLVSRNETDWRLAALSTRFCRRCRRQYLLDDVHRLLALVIVQMRNDYPHKFLKLLSYNLITG